MKLVFLQRSSPTLASAPGGSVAVRTMSTEKDNAVLNCIFNPLMPLTEFHPEEGKEDPDLRDHEEDGEEVKKAKELELKGVRAAEKGELPAAVEFFTCAIRTAPNRPSGYNNRAQAYRLMHREQEAMRDLDKAVELSEDGSAGCACKLSRCKALCQRALVYRKTDQMEKARQDLNKAALLGSHFAKQQLVEINPYAAMCNQMLNQVMNKLNTVSENGA